MLIIKELYILIRETCWNRRRIRLDFLRLGRQVGRGLGWGDEFAPDGISGWCLCRLAGKMGSFGKKVGLRRIGGGPRVGTGGGKVPSLPDSEVSDGRVGVRQGGTSQSEQ